MEYKISEQELQDLMHRCWLKAKKFYNGKTDEYFYDYFESEKKQLPIYGVSNRFDSKYTPPFRVGRKQRKAVLDANGREVIFFRDSEEQAKKYCDYLNGC